MHLNIKTQAQAVSLAVPKNLMLAAACVLACGAVNAQVAPAPSNVTTPGGAAKSPAHRPSRKPVQMSAVEQAPPPPPMPHWPVNDSPNPPSVIWDASGLRINASNSSLQQILNEVSTDTGTKVIGNVPDQRVFGSYGPGQASDVLLQLLQGSGFNVLLAGDLGHGAPSQIVLTPRHGGAPNPANGVNPQPQQAQPDQDEGEAVEQQEPPEQQQEETTVPAIPPPNAPGGQGQPGGPNGPMRTPQEIMQEMQQRQLLQQQQMQQQQMQQQQQGNPTAPQQPENPEDN